MSQPRVLVVDDDLALLQALPEALRLRMPGVTVETADSGAAALDRMAAWDYDRSSPTSRCPGWTVSSCWPRSGRSGPTHPR